YQIAIDARRIAELVIGLGERGVIRLPLVLERGEGGGIDAFRLELKKDRGLAWNDSKDDPRDVRRARIVVRIGDQHDLLPGLDLAEPVRSGSDRSREVLGSLAESALGHIRLQEMSREHRLPPDRERFRVRLAVADPDRVG